MRAVFLLALAGCLDRGAPPTPTEPPAGDVPRTHRLPQATDLDRDVDPPPVAGGFGDGLALGHPITNGRLSLIPIIDRAQPHEQMFITLQAGIASHQVHVTELEEIHAVRIENRSDQPLAIMGGELIIDGYQDRMIQHELVIAPRAHERVPVFCVERGRYEGNVWFHASHVLGEPALRTAAATGTQAEVWETVDRINAREGLAPPTSTYRHAARRQRSATIATRSTAVIAQLDQLEERDHVIGHAIAIDGKVVAIDQFATPALYRTLRPMVLASYLQVSQGPERNRGKHDGELSPAAVQTFARANRTTVIGAPPRSSRSQPAVAPPAALELQ